MSPAASGDRSGPLRLSYGAELEQLRLQIEVMALRVDQNLERMREVLVDRRRRRWRRGRWPPTTRSTP